MPSCGVRYCANYARSYFGDILFCIGAEVGVDVGVYAQELWETLLYIIACVQYSACGCLRVLSIVQSMLCPMVWHAMFIRAEGVTRGVCSCDCVRGGVSELEHNISSNVSIADSTCFRRLFLWYYFMPSSGSGRGMLALLL